MKNTKKNRITWGLIFLAAGVIYSYCIYLYEKKSIEKAPKIDFEHSLDSIDVSSIEFPRNAFYFKTGIYLNDTLYDTFVSHGSQIYGSQEIEVLRELPPPFIIVKEANTDTLKILKNNKMYYLLISEEIERRKNQ